MAILRLEWTPRAKGAVKSAGKSAKYYTFREGDDQAARIWYARDGRTFHRAFTILIQKGRSSSSSIIGGRRIGVRLFDTVPLGVAPEGFGDNIS